MNYSRRMASIYSPSLPRLCYLVVELIHRWEELDMQSRRMSGSTSSQSSADKGNQSKSDRGRDQNKDQTTLHCQGCNRDKHTREDCRYRAHPDFNFRGLCGRSSYMTMAEGRERYPAHMGRRTDGTTLPRVAPNTAVPPAPHRRDDVDDRDPQRRRDHDR